MPDPKTGELRGNRDLKRLRRISPPYDVNGNTLQLACRVMADQD
jgi:hypothetical protein